MLCTNPIRIQRAIESKACDAVLLKVNQIETLTEALPALRQARSAGWSVTLSVRSGETEDNWAADLATGWQADQLKMDRFVSLSDLQNITVFWKSRRRPDGNFATGRAKSEMRALVERMEIGSALSLRNQFRVHRDRKIESIIALFPKRLGRLSKPKGAKLSMTTNSLSIPPPSVEMHK